MPRTRLECLIPRDRFDMVWERRFARHGALPLYPGRGGSDPGTTPVPEPSTAVLMMLGLLGLRLSGTRLQQRG